MLQSTRRAPLPPCDGSIPFLSESERASGHHHELVARARAQLEALGVALPGSGVVLRQVWAPAKDILALRGDGRLLTFVDWPPAERRLRT